MSIKQLWRRNCCDGIYNSYDVHFTKFCDNKCAHCVDHNSIIVNSGLPDWQAMANAIIENQEGFDDVLILGGEPCLFLNEMMEFIRLIKRQTALKVYCTSSVPKTCYDNRDMFMQVVQSLDGFNISAQHHDEEIADQIRGVKSQFNRQELYDVLSADSDIARKIRINLNIVRGYLDTKQQLLECLLHYDKMGFNSFKLSEIQHSPNEYISFERIFGVKMGSPYFYGCQTLIDTEKVLGVELRTPLLLKRSCFICEKTLRASFLDGLKLMTKHFTGKPIIDNSHFGVVYEDGSIMKGWMKNETLLQIDGQD